MENVKVTVEEPSSVKRRISVEVPAEEVERLFRETYREYRRQASLPGFRKGKAPQSMIESLFKADVAQDVTRHILPESYEQALAQTGLKPLSEPEVGELKVERGQPLVYTAEFEVMPPFEVKDYTGLRIEGRSLEVAEEEVDALIEEIRAGQATLRKLEEDRGLRTGDVAMIDFEGKAGGSPIPGGSAADFPLTIGSDTILPGFEDSLVGAREGEEREFFLKLPADFHEAGLAGKEAAFKVRVKEIREKVLPPLDDDFAKDVGDYPTLDALRERLRLNLGATKEASAKGELREQIIEALLEAHPFDVPPSMVHHRRAVMLANVERNLMLRGVSKEEIEKSREKIFEDAAVPAERRVRASLIIGAIADREKLEVTEEELNGEIRKLAERNKLEPAEARRRMVENGSLEDLREMLREEKTLDFLLEKAQVTTGAAAREPQKGGEKK